jgi:hypothetical protein
MYKLCKQCGFKNPTDVGDCLVCRRSLPITVGEFRQRVDTLKRATKGDFSGVAEHTADEVVGNVLSKVKYRFHPLWILKIKLFRMKQSAISCLWIFGILAILVILGGIISALKK